MAAVSIPMVMLVAPAAGGYLGRWADQYFGSRPFGLIAGVVLGLVAAALRIRSILGRLK